MTKTLKLMLLTALLVMVGAAQTYTVPAGTTCTNSLNGCTLHDLTTADPTALTPFGWFVGGTYWTQFDFQQYQGQNAAAGATYCPGTGIYTQTARPDLGANYVEWTLSCTSTQWTNGSGSGELGVVGPYQIAVDIITVETQTTIRVCGRSGCSTRQQTVFVVVSGTVNLTPVSL